MPNTTVTTRSSSGIGFAGLLGLLFIAFKLAGVITWPWIWVLTPLWAGFALVVAILVLGGAVAGIAIAVAAALDRIRR